MFNIPTAIYLQKSKIPQLKVERQLEHVGVPVIKNLHSHCAECMERREWVCIDSLFTYNLHIYKMSVGQQIGRTAVVSVTGIRCRIVVPSIADLISIFNLHLFQLWNNNWNQHGTFLHIIFGLVSLMRARFKSNTHTHTPRDRLSRHLNLAVLLSRDPIFIHFKLRLAQGHWLDQSHLLDILLLSTTYYLCLVPAQVSAWRVVDNRNSLCTHARTPSCLSWVLSATGVILELTNETPLFSHCLHYRSVRLARFVVGVAQQSLSPTNRYDANWHGKTLVIMCESS